MCVFVFFFFFFQAEDGIRAAQESRGLGDVYKRQIYESLFPTICCLVWPGQDLAMAMARWRFRRSQMRDPGVSRVPGPHGPGVPRVPRPGQAMARSWPGQTNDGSLIFYSLINYLVN